MIMILMILSLTMSIIFIFMKHPLSMGMILLVQTILIAMLTGFMNLNFWFSYILFLIMIGGMLVLFIYMTSIASNEKFKYSLNLMIMIMFMMMTMILLFTLMDFYFLNMNSVMMESMNKNLTDKFSLSKFLNYPNNIILLMMIIYLFITLIAVVKITDIKIGPLRQKN